jgi:hypothetical protein
MAKNDFAATSASGSLCHHEKLGACVKWLNENAPAIQALASVAALIVTGVLAGLTWRYVRLTREIARLSLEQVQHIREAARVALRQSANALSALALRLRAGLGQLDPAMPNHRALRAFDILTEQDIAEMQVLARNVNAIAITSASAAADHLRVIYAMVQTAKGINEAMGLNMSSEDARRWKKAVEGAHRALQEIETACQRVAET